MTRKTYAVITQPNGIEVGYHTEPHPEGGFKALRTGEHKPLDYSHHKTEGEAAKVVLASAEFDLKIGGGTIKRSGLRN